MHFRLDHKFVDVLASCNFRIGSKERAKHAKLCDKVLGGEDCEQICKAAEHRDGGRTETTAERESVQRVVVS